MLLFSVVFSFGQAPPFASNTGNLNDARYFHTSALLNDGTVLILGGDAVTGGFLNTAEIFNPVTGTFSRTTGNMALSREHPTATVLQNGTVLITGGFNGVTYLSSAEIYNPATGTFAPTGTMNSGRAYHAASILPDGRVLIAGGFDGTSYLNTAELYDPSTGTFTSTGNMGAARYLPTATLLQNGKVFIAGGHDPSSALTSTEVFDSGTGTFSSGPNMGAAHYLHTATLLKDGRVLIAGGYDGVNIINTVDIYDPVTNNDFYLYYSFMSTGRYYHTATLLNDGRVVLAGGLNSSANPTNTTEVFDPALNYFSNTGSMASARYLQTATLLPDGRVLVAGGKDTSGALNTAEILNPFTNTGSMALARRFHTATVLNSGLVLIAGGSGSATADLFDPNSGNFTPTGSMSTGRNSHSATLLDDGRVLIAGGCCSNNLAEIYDPNTTTFSSISPMNANRGGHLAVVLNDGRVLLAGGYDGATFLNSAEIFDPATSTFTPVPSAMFQARYAAAATLLPDGRVLISGGYAPAPVRNAEIFDPGTMTFTRTGDMTIERFSHTMTLLNNGLVLVTGGNSAPTTSLSSAELYDPNTGTFTATGIMNGARYEHVAVLLRNGTVLIAGGHTNTTNLASVEIFDPATNSFYTNGLMSAARFSPTATLLNDGRVLIAGGNNGSADLASAELFYAASDIPANLSYITVTPANPSGSAGASLNMVATGTFGDNHTEKLQSVVWTSSNTSVISVTNDATNRGHIFDVGNGGASVGACAGYVCGSTQLSVGGADLVVGISGPTNALSATNVFTYTIHNNGPGTATSVFFIGTFDYTYVTLNSFATTVGTCNTDGNLYCSFGDLAPGATVTVTMNETFPYSTFFYNTGTASSADDLNSANNTASVSTAYGANVALNITGADWVMPAGNVVMYVTVYGYGPAPSTNTAVTVTLPSGVTFVSATGATCSGSPILSCNIGTVGEESSVQFQLQLNGAVPGVYLLPFTLGGDQPDFYPQDNVVVQQLVVTSNPVGTLERESVDSAGTEGQDNSYYPVVSDTGRYVAFETDSLNLVPNYSVVLHDNCRGASAGCVPSTIPVAIGSNGNPVYAYYASISGNGRFVGFSSNDAGLPGGNGSLYQAYVRDTCIGAPAGCVPSTSLVSQSSLGVIGNGYSDYERGISFSPDGRYIAFVSDSSNLTADPDNNGQPDIFLRDTCVGAPAGCTPSTTLVSVSIAGTSSTTGWSESPSISADGRYVSWDSDALDVASGANGYYQIVRRDTCTGILSGCTPSTSLVSLNTSAAPGNSDSYYSSMSRDGRYIAFESYADDLVAGDSNASEDVFVRDTCLGASGCTPTTVNASISTAGVQGAYSSFYASLNANGRFVAYISDSPELDPRSDSENHAFVHDTCFGAPAGCIQSTLLLDASPGGTLANDLIEDWGTISGDGSVVVFDSYADNLVGNDTNFSSDIFLAGTGLAGTAGADLRLVGTGPASPAPAGNNLAYHYTVINLGSIAAGNAVFTESVPSGATLVSAVPSVGSCTGPVCNLGNLASGAAATIDVVLSPGALAQVTNTADVNFTGTDLNPADNLSTLITDLTTGADIVLSTTSIGGSATNEKYVYAVTDNGPSAATSVAFTDKLDRFQFVSATPSQGSCTFSSGTINCSLGTINSGSSVSITVLVTGPRLGWASQQLKATTSALDPNPTNNSIYVGPPTEGFNTQIGNLVSVSLADIESGMSASVTFSSITRPGTTTIRALTGLPPAPAGYRSYGTPVVFDLSTSADFVGPITIALPIAAGGFRHPSQVHLFHLEGGAWVDRTTGVNTLGVVGVSASLSPFALFEPVDVPPVANGGADRLVAGALAIGAAMALDASASSDADGDALSYRWTGPFAEGAVANGAHPNVTLPFGTSKVTLVVNDGEVDSPAVSFNVTVSDFGLAAPPSAAMLARGQSGSYTMQVAPKFGAFHASVALSCSTSVPGVTCTAPSSVVPGVNGAEASVMVNATSLAHSSHYSLAWLAVMLGPLGLTFTGSKRRVRLLLLALVLLVLTMVACGGGGMNSTSSSSTQSSKPATNVVVTVTGTSGAVQHSSSFTVVVQ